MKWNENIIKYELKSIIKQINHFPTRKELQNLNRNDLEGAISRHGGLNKFRILLGYKLLQKPNGYWTEENTIKELKEVIEKLGHFPSTKELINLNRQDLVGTIFKHGGINKFYKFLKYKPIQKHNYWNEKIIIKELKKIINELGHFPNNDDFIKIKRTDLLRAIEHRDGIIKFKIILDIKLNRVPNNYYNDKTITEEITSVYDKIGRFPTHDDLISINKSGLSYAITTHGGYFKFKKIFGYTISIYDEYRSKLMSYIQKRGRISEKIVKQILIDYCYLHNISNPQYNIKFSNGKIIEFVCNIGKNIGIDVTNTRRKQQISNKWKHKQYHNHLDELWIVVFSNTFTEQDYIKWNAESPSNVKIFSIYDFLKELDYSLDESTKTKIDKYNECTFHTKEELKRIKSCLNS